MKIGYARVSTTDQNLDRQRTSLNNYGIDKIIEEKFTGTRKDREGINRLLDTARQGDTIVVESISRLGRNTLDILSLVEDFHKKGIKFVSLKEGMDTETPTGKAMFQMMSVIAELERNLIAERVKEGLAATKRRGTQLGRPKVDKNKINKAIRLYDSGEWSIKEICEMADVSQGSLYKAINKRKTEISQE